MSDLISRSELILRLSDYALQEAPNDNESTGEQILSKMIYDTIQNCISCVEEQPTAYDIDKVFKELEELAENNRQAGFDIEKNGFSIVADKMYGKQCAFLQAIEIVKQGGVGTETMVTNDDVCEWKYSTNKIWNTDCKTQSVHYPVGYMYCPYCGKKIKVVK